MPGVVSSSNFALLLEPKLRQIFFETYDEVPEQYSKVFNVKGSKKAQEHDFHITATGEWKKKESMGGINYQTIDPSFEVHYTHEEWADGIQVERKLIDDEMYDVINKLPATLARTGRATVERVAASVLNDGFTANGYDGKPLFADDHPLEKSNIAGDNKVALTLTDTNLKAAMVLFRAQRDGAGLLIQTNPKKLIVPPDLEFTALTLLQSVQVAGTDFNDANVIKGRLDPVVLDYLEDPKAWFLQDPVLHEMNFFWRIKPEFKRVTNEETMIAKFIGYMRFSVGYSDWRGMLGSKPEEAVAEAG